MGTTPTAKHGRLPRRSSLLHGQDVPGQREETAGQDDQRTQETVRRGWHQEDSQRRNKATHAFQRSPTRGAGGSGPEQNKGRHGNRQQRPPQSNGNVPSVLEVYRE